jgi:GT2 family glycosyltransferase
LVLPKVSVLTTTYNRKEKLLRLLTSLLESRYPQDRLEIVVVDDASTDGTYDEVAKRFPFVNLIRNNEEKLSSGSRNIGLKKCLGDYIFWIDDDNVVESNCIPELIGIMESDRRIGAAGPLMLCYDLPNLVWSVGGNLNSHTLVPKNLYEYNEFDKLKLPKVMVVDYFPNSSMLRKEVIQRNVFYDEYNFPHNWAEQDFFIKISNLGFKVVAVTTAIIWHDVGYRGRVTRIGKYKAYDQAKSKIVFIKKYGSKKLLIWSLFILPFSTFFYAYMAIRSGYARDVIGHIKSYLLGIVKGLTWEVK